MKLVTYHRADGYRLGAILDHHVIDLQDTWRASERENPTGDGARVDDFPSSMLDFLRRGSQVWEMAQAIVAWAASGSIPQFVRYPLEDTRLAPSVPDPSKIVCVGLNYMDHCLEQNVEVPERPMLFAKFPSALIGPGELITWPAGLSAQVDYEAELAVIIGRTARNVPAQQAYDYIAGYTIANDISARDVQFADVQWVRGKSFDTFCPLGPYLLTRDEVGDPHNLAIRCRLNGELMQDSNTDQLIFKIPQLLEFITSTSTLYPGDIICTGTPDGVGVFRAPPVFLKPGDVIEVEIEGLGRLRNPIV
jgi:2-keto-4-pentenoate hydratase/2-oxohepta-3-ene-1,7-dioic acid hydratase in catechol pathway